MEETTSEGLREFIQTGLDARKPIVLSDLAARFDVTELTAARTLPEDVARFAAPARFEEVWTALTGWEKATLILQHRGSVLEIKGRMPAGSFGHGYFNLKDGDNPLGGHIKADGLAAIGFLSLPFMGLESHSVQFFDSEGAVVFGVYAGREGRALIPAVRESFFALRDAVCAGGNS